MKKIVLVFRGSYDTMGFDESTHKIEFVGGWVLIKTGPHFDQLLYAFSNVSVVCAKVIQEESK